MKERGHRSAPALVVTLPHSSGVVPFPNATPLDERMAKRQSPEERFAKPGLGPGIVFENVNEMALPILVHIVFQHPEGPANTALAPRECSIRGR